jgi:hypothetical protein
MVLSRLSVGSIPQRSPAEAVHEIQIDADEAANTAYGLSDVSRRTGSRCKYNAGRSAWSESSGQARSVQLVLDGDKATQHVAEERQNALVAHASRRES